MQLRSTTRLPGRYRDDDVPDLPGTAPFVHPTVPYNPNLPPAVFPTLDFPRPVDIRTEEVMELPSRLESPESDPDQEALSKRATVFHGKQQSSDELLQRGLSSGAKSEEVAAPEPDTSRQQEWDLPDENDTDPGEYDGWGVTANDNGGDESPRIGLSVYELAGSWSRVTDGLKLIITMELTAVYSFEDTMKKLMLTDEEHNEVIDLFEQELARQAEEDVKIARSQALQLEMLLSGATATSRESFSASLGEGLYTDLDNSPMFIVKKSDIAHAQRFLRSVKLKEYVNRLWRYEGVALPPIVWNVSGSKNNEPSNAIEWSLLEDEQQDFQALENAQIGFKLGEKRKGKALLRKVDKLLSGAKPVKRRRIDSGPVSSKLPSGLRNSISGDNLEETVATGPPALQATLSPHRQPAPPSRRQPPKEKKSGVQHVRFIRKSSEKPQTLQTLPKQPYNPLEHTPDLAIARKHTHSWLADQGEPYTPLASASEKTPSPQSTPSHAPKARLTPSQARLAQIENILGKKTHAAINLVTPNKAYAVSIAPTTGAPPDILSEKTRSASRHADAELTPVSGRIESKTRDGTDLTHKLVREVCKEPTSAAQAQGDNVAIEPCQKKRKIQKQDDTTYRTSGQRRPKTQGQDESSYKAAGQKRRKIQGREKGNEHPSPGKENMGKGVAEKTLSGAAAILLAATKVSISEASAAKFKGVKLLELVIRVPAVKTNDSDGPTKETSMTDDGKQTVGQKRKARHDPDDGPDC